SWRLVAVLVHPIPARDAFERQATREHFVDDNAKRIDIAAHVELFFALELLGAHVRGRTKNSALNRELLLALRVFGPALSDAKVQNFNNVFLAGALGQKDVCGFEIAMDDALVVRLLEGTADLRGDAVDAL